jgi:hypothetical protein
MRSCRVTTSIKGGYMGGTAGVPTKQIDFSQETRDRVKELAAEGKDVASIAAIIGVPRALTNNKFRHEIKVGYEIAKENGISVANAELRNGYIPTEADHRQVRELAKLGLTYNQICAVMNLSYSNIQNIFYEDVEIGRAQGVQKVATVLYDMATDHEHPNETKFYLKSQAGWKEATQVEFPDANGRPQSISGNTINLNLSTENLTAIIGVLNDEV